MSPLQGRRRHEKDKNDTGRHVPGTLTLATLMKILIGPQDLARLRPLQLRTLAAYSTIPHSTFKKYFITYTYYV